MYENSFIDSFSFCLLSHFEIIGCIAESLIGTSMYFFVEIQLKKVNLKSVFWTPVCGVQTNISLYQKTWIRHYICNKMPPCREIWWVYVRYISHVFKWCCRFRKDVLVKTIAEYLVRIVKHHNQRLDQPSVLVTASTGKAATNIDSVTLHSAFHLPVKRGFYVQPGAEVLYILKIRYAYLKILVIDEISMTGLYFAIWWNIFPGNTWFSSATWNESTPYLCRRVKWNIWSFIWFFKLFELHHIVI